jgi:hypothetical protein
MIIAIVHGCAASFPYCSSCKRLDLCCPQWIHFGSSENHGMSWNIMECPGTSWNVLEHHGMSWNVMECPGTSWNVLEHYGMLWNWLEQDVFF